MDFTSTPAIQKRPTTTARNLLVFTLVRCMPEPKLTTCVRAFGSDKRVAHLNYDIFLSLKDCSPAPHILSQRIRCLRTFVLRFFSWRWSARRNRLPDTEKGRPSGHETSDSIALAQAQVSEEKRRFRMALEKKFGDVRLVSQVMRSIEEWEDPPTYT